MAKTREEVALGIVPPIYPPLMVRALEKLNANPRYQNNPLKMSEFFQRQQDAINKVTGKNFQLVPATEEQDWMESLPPALYKKVTSGNLFQFKHVESVVRRTVGQNLRPSMGGNSGTFGDIVNTARASGAKFPELVAAQWALESNFGKAPSGMNNFFGMKATPNETSTSRMTTEYRDGALNTESANFKDYASKEDSVNDLVNRWYKNYESYQGINNANSIEEAAQMLQQQGYATDPDYANKLIQILKNNIGRQ
jgi:flagellum-specific peptidoglycan hydrolase FlgJ